MPKVLHIEDDPNNRQLVKKVLSADGFTVVNAIDGVTGIKTALAAQPDIILMDIELPDMDGYEVTLKLRGELEGHDVPIVAVTGMGDKDMIEAVGCDGHIFKPIDVAKLPGQVRSFLRAGRKVDSGKASDTKTTSRDDLLRVQGQKIAGRLQTKIEELEKANRLLLESEKVRSEFYRNLSHELSTPLTPVVGYLNMLQGGELGPLDPLQLRSLESVNRGITRVRAVVENLLDMTALTTGKMTFFSRFYDFNRLARESINLCEDSFTQRGIDLEIAIPEKMYKGFGDPDKLKRAMVQLLENAVKFCRGDGKVHVCTRLGAERLSFLVYDSGKGIPKDELQSIFKTFYQIDGSPTREHGGAGLGLALARKIVERFGGEIWAESPPRGEASRLQWANTMVGLWVPERMTDDEDLDS